MKILRLQFTREYLYTQAQRLLNDALGPARHLLQFQPDGDDLILVHRVTGHRIGTPATGDTAEHVTRLHYNEQRGQRYVDYVLDDLTRTPMLDAHVDPMTAEEHLVVHEDTLPALAEGLRRTLAGPPEQQHALALAVFTWHLAAQNMHVQVDAFVSQNETSRAVLIGHNLRFTAEVTGTLPLLLIRDAEDGSPIAEVIPDEQHPQTWVLLDPQAREALEQYFGPALA